MSCYENGTVVVHVLDEDSIVDTGSLNLFYNNSAIGTGYVHNGEAVINITGLEPGNYSVIAFYFGKEPFDSASKSLNLTVLPVTPVVDENITISVPSISGKPGSNTTVTINVTNSNGTIVNTGNITITINGENYTAKVINGASNVNITLPDSVGVNNITVTYTNGSYSTSVNSTILVTNDTGLINTVLVGYNLTKTYGTLANYTGKLLDEYGNPIMGQHIALNLTRLSDGASKIYYATTDTQGEYQLAINLSPGEYSVQASYAGNGNYTGFNASINSIKVLSNESNTSLIAYNYREA